MSTQFGSNTLFVPQHQKQNLSHLPGNLKSMISLKHSQFFNFHYRLCGLLKIATTDNFILLHKSHILKNPPSLCWVLFNVRNSNFMFLVYSQLERKFHKFYVEERFILSQLPFAMISIAKKDYLNLGKRLFLGFKNRILIQYA
jgi:hypothetical protein